MVKVRQVEGRSSGKTGWVHPKFGDAIKKGDMRIDVPVFRAPSAKQPAREVPAYYLQLVDN